MKLLALLLTILLAVSTTACQKETPPDTSMEFNFETDCQYYLNSDGNYRMAEASTGYYYISTEPRGFLRYIDKETLQDTLVCAKPNCLHDKNEDITQCNAYISPYSYGRIVYHEGFLYVFTLDFDPVTTTKMQSIVRVSTDGFQRKKVWNMTWEAEKQLPNVSKFIVHRGHLYFLVCGSDTYDESSVYLYEYDLKKKRCSLIEDDLTGINDIFAVGDMLYLKAYEKESGLLLHYQYHISQKEMMLVEDSYGLKPYSTGIVCMRYNTDQHFKMDLEARNQQELPQLFDTITVVSEDYMLTNQRTVIRTEDGKKVTSEEYRDYVGNYHADMTVQEYERFVQRQQEFEIYWEEKNTILDATTYEVLGEVELPEMGFSFIQGDYLFAFDTRKEVLQKIDLSKCGTEDFEWQRSEKMERN